jgi:HK97 family phage major capsid protein
VSGAGGTTEAAGFLLDAAGLASFNSGAANAITADGLIDLYHGLKTAYAKNGVWTLNRSTLGAIRKLKDDNGQYLWVPGIANGIANTILGSSYAEMSDMPNIAANAYPVAFADWKKLYVIIDRVGISFQPDYMTGADDGLVVFRARKRTGGGVRQAEAGVRLKIAA